MPFLPSHIEADYEASFETKASLHQFLLEIIEHGSGGIPNIGTVTIERILRGSLFVIHFLLEFILSY